MSYNNQAISFKGLSHVTATLDGRTPQLGQQAYDSDGNQYVWAYNASNSVIPKGVGCVIASNVSGPFSMTLTAATSADLGIGVVKHESIPTANYGYILTRGIGVAEMGGTSGTVAANGLLEMAAAGVWVPVSNTTGNLAPAPAKALSAIVSNASGKAYFNF